MRPSRSLRQLRRPRTAISAAPPLLLVVTGGLIAVATMLKGLALYNGWFYGDDYVLLMDAVAEQQINSDYLLEPYVARFMPGERLVFWLVAQSGTLNWPVAATIVVFLQAAAATAAAWMLFTLFGARWAAVGLLAIYVTTAMTLPATLWFAAACDQIPPQIAFFLGVGSWVNYLRGKGWHWLVLTLAATVFGLAFYVKTVLLFPVLAYLAVAYFVTGSIRERLVTAVVRWWPAVLSGTTLAVGYAAYTASRVQQPFVETNWHVAFDVAETMIGSAFATAAFGGPWRWSTEVTPNANAAPPLWTQHAAWALIALIVAYAALRRRRTWRGWSLLVGYLAAIWFLVATSRAPFIGGAIGLQYRYLTDAACVLVLCAGLVFLRLQGAPESSLRREQPLLTPRVPAKFSATGVTLVCGMGITSSAMCADIWIDTNASEPFTRNLAADLDGAGSVELVDRVLPETVLSGLLAPDNRLSSVAPLLSNDVRFPEVSASLGVVSDEGHVHAALIESVSESLPGPREGCGWLVTARGRDIPMQHATVAGDWWIRIGYLASAPSPVRISTAGDVVETQIRTGLNSLYVHSSASLSSLKIAGLDPGVRLCVDTIEVGVPVAGATL